MSIWNDMEHEEDAREAGWPDAGARAPGCGGPLVPGLLAGTKVATDEGWRGAETIAAGTRVLTFDRGSQPVRSVIRRLCGAARDAGPQALVRVPENTIGNRETLTLLPDQGVMLESDLAEDAWGDPFALVTASALTCLPGVDVILAEAPVVAVTLEFDADEVVFAAGQALIHCPSPGAGAPMIWDDALISSAPRYRMLAADDAHRVAIDVATALARNEGRRLSA